MDITQMNNAQIATTAVSLLAPYLTKAGEAGCENSRSGCETCPTPNLSWRLNAPRRTWWARYQAALDKGDTEGAGYARTQHDRLREGMARVETMGAYPFAHPYYWGAFQAVGAAF